MRVEQWPAGINADSGIVAVIACKQPVQLHNTQTACMCPPCAGVLPCVCCAGLTKVPIDGQPLSIVQDLEDMCRQYIKVKWQ